MHDSISFTQKTFNLRQLTEKHTHFQWKKCHQLEFDNLRHALRKNTLLTFFQLQQPTFLYVDAHIISLSATLLQVPMLQMLNQLHSPTEQQNQLKAIIPN